MIKQPKLNIANTNIAMLGSDLDKKCRMDKAQLEAQWKTAGKKEGIQVWRIENFKVVPWPQDQYGKFFDGDSYIVLHSMKSGPSFTYDIYFWLGLDTTTDEAGTAAYKTVELDDFFGGAPTQYREVMNYESDSFLRLFPNNSFFILHGGVDSGFNHVGPKVYKPRLLHIQTTEVGFKKCPKVIQVELAASSLNNSDSFILDAGEKIYVFNGSKANPSEVVKAGSLATQIKGEHKGIPSIETYSETDKDIPAAFWTLLGGKPAKIPDAQPPSAALKAIEKTLFRLSDATGKLEFTQVAKGKIARSQLNTNDVFILDLGFELYIWVGQKANANEKKNSFKYATDYLEKNGHNQFTPVIRIVEGGHCPSFDAAFN
ncbi:hypothetical protein SAMD00019534_042870 [Acytostelium subglobosum LB1]|uniref:hypothetical protein n=1 Tax=Acytostelium subglobosum LB1 TaxID=1410327 RepID=UPI000644D29B|nr:hypothetical protein SAMD00019534_042870 [Acytostelium subglobosum LB1]GAM21112.1 hypothetical protein SAMD00019534_042870 [Acytostelium subglobosum LB1]|eukprot:XP_012756246.1 hypothetical protein SAMD00019534_042870 [Acytostelium subglobosum LB1]